MRMVIDAAALSAAISRTRLFAGNVRLRPGLANTLISARNASGCIDVIALGMDSGACHALAASDVCPGNMLLSPVCCRYLDSLSGDVEISCADRIALVKSSSGEAQFPCDDADEYPQWPAHQARDIEPIPEDVFARGVHVTRSTTDPGSIKYALGGVHFSRDGIASTDTRSAAIFPLPQRIADSLGDSRASIPPEFLRAAAKAMSGCGEVFMGLSENIVTLGTGGGALNVFSKLIEGKFPSLQQAIPAEYGGILVISGELLDAARQMSILADSENQSIDAVADGETLRLSIQAFSGRASTAIKIAGGNVEDFKPIILQCQRLINAVMTDREEMVCIKSDGKRLNLWADYGYAVMGMEKGGGK